MIYRISHYFNKNLVLLLSFFLLHSANMNAMALTNNSDDKVMKELRAQAIRYDRRGDVYNAIEYYKRYLSYNGKDIKLTYRLATLYFNTRDYMKANQYYDSVISINPRKYVLSYYRKGLVCMNLGKYDKAKESFTKFRKYYRSKKDKLYYRRLATIYIASSDWAKTNTNEDGNLFVEHPGGTLNHPDIDFAPFPINDKQILYGSLNSESSVQTNPVRQIFKAEKIDEKWKTTGLLEGEINDPEVNTGNAVLSADGKSLFFTRTRTNWQNKDISEI